MTMCKNINAFLYILQYESMNRFHDISALKSAKRIAPVYNGLHIAVAHAYKWALTIRFRCFLRSVIHDRSFFWLILIRSKRCRSKEK